MIRVVRLVIDQLLEAVRAAEESGEPLDRMEVFVARKRLDCVLEQDALGLMEERA